MPIFHKEVRRTSCFRKRVAYHETWKQTVHTAVYGIKKFRVLTVTSSSEQVGEGIDTECGYHGDFSPRQMR